MASGSASAILAAEEAGASPAPEAEHLRLSETAAERFRRALDQHHQFVWRTLRRFGVDERLVDDATQGVFITFARRLERVEPNRERAFLVGVCTGIASNFRRQRGRRREVSDDTLGDEPDGAGTPEDLLEAKRRRRLLDQALEQLPLELRTVFMLYEVEGLSLQEVAASLGIPFGTAASRLRRSRERFQQWVRAQRRARILG